MVPRFSTLPSAGFDWAQAKIVAQNSGAQAGQTGPSFRRRPTHKSTDFGPAGKLAVSPMHSGFREFEYREFDGAPLGIRNFESRTEVRNFAPPRFRRGSRLFLRGFRPKTRPEIRGVMRARRGRGFGGGLLTGRPISGGPANLPILQGKSGNPDLGISATICKGPGFPLSLSTVSKGVSIKNRV